MTQGAKTQGLVAPLRWGAVLSLFGLLFSGCSKDDPSSEPAECERGDERSCRGDDGCAGRRVCGGMPLRWQACECDTEVMTPLVSSVGRACADATDCSEGDVCLNGAQDFLGGELVSGTCAVDCSEDPGICGRLSSAAVCVKASTGEISMESMAGDDERAYCFQSCNLGDEASSRCSNRDDVACSGLTDGAAFCRPLCSSDAQCAGKYCDPLLGVCVDEPAVGANLGAQCDPDADDPGCQGLCLTVGDVSSCTSRCVYGRADDCGNSELSRPGLCFIPEGAGSIGDVGFCSQLCDCNGQCFHSGMICDPFMDPPLEELLGAKGVCVPRSGGQDAGADGGAGVTTEGIPCPLE
jgi:hypothetical protein